HGEIKEAELVAVTFYEVEIRKGEHVREIKIFPNGQVINEDVDDDDENESNDDDHGGDDDDNHEHHEKHKGKSDGRSSK
ncbi:MAG: hypothetical protein IT367_11605, partial [Candidatus Hydrogenedentes bacterium]|nr:hypothetical protein [Candidatus Hydrogenedentota bacterium]